MVTKFQSGYEKWVVVNEVPTCIQTYGAEIGEEIKSDTIIVVVPGNPGVTDFYVSFMKSLQLKCGQHPVWVVGHAGHEFHPECPSLTKRPELFNLAAQVKHKVDFITKHIPNDRKVILIGHSIGAKICVELMKNEMINKRVNQMHLLFPTLEHIAETKNGRWFQRVLSRLAPILTFLTCVLVACTPEFLRFYIIKTGSMVKFRTTNVDDCIVHGVMKLVKPPIIRQTIFLAKDEMMEVQELDHEVYLRHGSKIVAYYAQEDGWSPLAHRENLKSRYPYVTAPVMEGKFEHAFMIHCASEMAEKVAISIQKKNDENS